MMSEISMEKNKIKNSISLPTHIKVYIQKDGTILIYDLLDDFIDVAYNINPDEKRIKQLHYNRKKNRVNNLRKALKTIKKHGVKDGQ